MRKLSVKLLALSLLSLMSIGAYGYDKDLKEHITISHDMMVGHTTIKQGDYLVKYHAATSEVSFLNVNKNKVVATAMAVIKVNEKKAASDALYSQATPEGEKLTGLRLGGQREEIVLIEPVAVLPLIEVDLLKEIVPLCYWEEIPLSDDMEEVVVSEVDGILPDMEITNYRLVCRPSL